MIRSTLPSMSPTTVSSLAQGHTHAGHRSNPNGRPRPVPTGHPAWHAACVRSVLPEALADAAERSAAPDAVAIALRRVLEERPSTEDRFLRRAEPSPLAQRLHRRGGGQQRPGPALRGRSVGPRRPRRTRPSGGHRRRRSCRPGPVQATRAPAHRRPRPARHGRSGGRGPGSGRHGRRRARRRLAPRRRMRRRRRRSPSSAWASSAAANSTTPATST